MSADLPARLRARAAVLSQLDDTAALLREAADAIEVAGWQPIETLPEGEHVLLYWRQGERGAGGMECATVFRNDNPDNLLPPMFFWTHGGPNSGSDWDPKEDHKTDEPEMPSFWMKLPDPPTKE